MTSNPFAALPGALQNSSYGAFDGSELLVPEATPHPRQTLEVHGALRALLHDPDYPCVGAKSVINQNSYRFGLYQSLGEAESTAGLAYDLYHFIQERPSLPGEFTSFIGSFIEPKLRKPKEFEELLWKQLAALHLADREFFEWNPDVSHDPADSEFSFSFAGNAFFVVGLSPASQRWARRFPWPTLVFNDHGQFERLREEHRFDRIREVIRDRDTAVHGSENEMLSDYGGAHSEARQYAGRRVGENWRCPVHFD
jgi:FPC/CPF motif-containing protein YcgG